MTDANSSQAANACLPCKQHKRKCNKILPSCATCLRVGRDCIYEDDTPRLLSHAGSSRRHSLASKSGSDNNPLLGTSSSSFTGLLRPALSSVDPFIHDTLRQPFVDTAVGAEASKILGTPEEIHGMVARYLDTAHRRIPIVSKEHLFERLPSIFAKPHADFIVLCLCIHLLLQMPVDQGQSMQSSLYVMVKSNISLLESTGYLSLEVVQSRVLLSYYEMGHGILPAALISIGACARAARALGLHKKLFHSPSENSGARMRAEEEKRVWWAVINLDRFINMCNEDALFGTEDPQTDDCLPIDDKIWAQHSIPATNHITLATPSDITVSAFARECQISHLVGRVLRHIYDPTADPSFHAEEAKQLERTLMAFMPLLIEEESTFGLYCAALGICSSALFMLYESELLLLSQDENNKQQILTSIESYSEQITQFSAYLFGDEEKINFETFSPFVPFSLYQAAAVQLRLWKQRNEMVHMEALHSLKKILGYFSRRWLTASMPENALFLYSTSDLVRGKYLDALETLV